MNIKQLQCGKHGEDKSWLMLYSINDCGKVIGFNVLKVNNVWILNTNDLWVLIIYIILYTYGNTELWVENLQRG